MTDTRICKKCKRPLPVAQFRPDQRSKAGNLTRTYTCRDCHALRRAALRAHPDLAAGERRVCKTCGQDKPLTAFYKTNIGHRQTTCKTCHIRQGTERRRQRATTDPQWAEAYRQRHARNEAARRMRRALRRGLREGTQDVA